MGGELTEGEHAEDDGLGDEVDGVAGAGEVQLALPVLLVIVHKLLANLHTLQWSDKKSA